jgi:putative nucleotidyltransferase with HDIG domain
MTPRELVAGIGDIVTLPEVYLRVRSLLDDPRSSAADIAEVVSHDPALTLRLLKLVNSAFYGFPAKIGSVSHAITIVGTRELHNLVLATTAPRALEGLEGEPVDLTTFWHHSVYTAMVARLLARERGLRNTEYVFVAGLLHDVGQLVLRHVLPEVAEAVLEEGEQALGYWRAERARLGFCHAEVGGALMSEWGLPEGLCEAVACHHEPGRAEAFPVEAALVHIANAIADTVEPPRGGRSPEAVVDPGAWERAGLTPELADPVRQEASLLSLELLHIIFPDAMSIY